MLKVLLGVAIGLWLAAPVMAQAPAPGFAAIHSIGVISALGDRAEIKYVGAMVFGNKLTYLPISDWDLDALAAAEATKALGERFVVKPVSADPARFADVHSSMFKSEASSLEAAMRLLPPSDVDAYLVLLPSSEQLPSTSNQFVSGPGVYRQWPGIGGPDFQLHAGEAIVHLTYVVYLVDARTGHVITGRPGVTPGREKRSLTATLLLVGTLSSPHVYTRDGSWPTVADALTEPQKATLRDDLTGLIKASVGYTLTKMGLAAEAKAPAGG